MASKNLNPDRLLKCKGEGCQTVDPLTKKVVRKEYKARELITWPTNKSLLLCPSCYSKENERRVSFQRLEETIKRIFKISAIPQGIYVQIKNMKQKHDISNEDIRLTLEYFVSQKDGKFDKMTIGIVPYVLEEAQAFQRQQKARLEQLSKQTELESLQMREVIKITMPYPKRKFDYRKEQLIDLEELKNELGK